MGNPEDLDGVPLSIFKLIQGLNSKVTSLIKQEALYITAGQSLSRLPTLQAFPHPT